MLTREAMEGKLVVDKCIVNLTKFLICEKISCETQEYLF